MKKLFSKLMVSIVIGGTLLSGMSYAVTDVPYYHWAEQSVKMMVAEGVISGYPDGTFKPDNTISREEVSKMISIYIGGDYTGENVFKDVDPDGWSAKHINHLASKKIINGYENGEFKPKENLSRAQFSNIIYKYLDSEGKITNSGNVSLSDIGSSWAKDAIQKVANSGYLKGYDDGTFKPDNSITRAEVSSVLAQINGLVKNYYQAGTYTVGKDIPAGEYLVITNNPSVDSDLKAYVGDFSDDPNAGHNIFHKTSIVTVSDGQTLKLTNSKALSMSLVTDELTPPDPNNLGPGAYRVGKDIPAGKYAFSLNATRGNYTNIAKNTTHRTDSIIHQFHEGDYTLSEGEYLFVNNSTSSFVKID